MIDITDVTKLILDANDVLDIRGIAATEAHMVWYKIFAVFFLMLGLLKFALDAPNIFKAIFGSGGFLKGNFNPFGEMKEAIQGGKKLYNKGKEYVKGGKGFLGGLRGAKSGMGTGRLDKDGNKKTGFAGFWGGLTGAARGFGAGMEAGQRSNITDVGRNASQAGKDAGAGFDRHAQAFGAANTDVTTRMGYIYDQEDSKYKNAVKKRDDLKAEKTSQTQEQYGRNMEQYNTLPYQDWVRERETVINREVASLGSATDPNSKIGKDEAKMADFRGKHAELATAISDAERAGVEASAHKENDIRNELAAKGITDKLEIEKELHKRRGEIERAGKTAEEAKIEQIVNGGSDHLKDEYAKYYEDYEEMKAKRDEKVKKLEDLQFALKEVEAEEMKAQDNALRQLASQRGVAVGSTDDVAAMVAKLKDASMQSLAASKGFTDVSALTAATATDMSLKKEVDDAIAVIEACGEEAKSKVRQNSLKMKVAQLDAEFEMDARYKEDIKDQEKEITRILSEMITKGTNYEMLKTDRLKDFEYLSEQLEKTQTKLNDTAMEETKKQLKSIFESTYVKGAFEAVKDDSPDNIKNKELTDLTIQDMTEMIKMISKKDIEQVTEEEKVFLLKATEAITTAGKTAFEKEKKKTYQKQGGK